MVGLKVIILILFKVSNTLEIILQYWVQNHVYPLYFPIINENCPVNYKGCTIYSINNPNNDILSVQNKPYNNTNSSPNILILNTAANQHNFYTLTKLTKPRQV